MTDITARGEKRLVLAAGRAHPELAREIAKELGTELLPVDAYDFAVMSPHAPPSLDLEAALDGGLVAVHELGDDLELHLAVGERRE